MSFRHYAVRKAVTLPGPPCECLPWRSPMKTASGNVHDAGSTMAGNDWMSTVSDDLCITKMAIPGTHDTGAYEAGNWVSRPMTYAQFSDIPTQLGMGIRALDLRLGGNYNWFASGSGYSLYHGPFQLPDSVDTVIDSVVALVTNNPSEFVILMLKFEAWGGMDWSEHFDTWLNGRLGGLLHKRPVATQARWPLLRELRQKVMVLSRVKAPHADHYSTVGWSGNFDDKIIQVGSGLEVQIQDLYDKPFLDVKKTAVKRAISAANNSGDRKRLHLNFTSYVVNNKQPRDVGDADGMNAWLQRLEPISGVICVDGAKAPLAKYIYSQTPGAN